jgi:Xaa-Pro dipeptidase
MDTTRAMARSRKLAQALGAAGLDHLVVYGNAWTCDYLRYATDFAVLEGHAVAVVSSGAVRLFLESDAEARRARAEVPALEVTWLPDFHAGVQQVLAGLQGSVGCAPRAYLPQGVMAGLSQATDFTPAFVQLMMIKLPEEIEAVRRATALADEGYEAFRHAAREGRHEYEVIADMEQFFRSRGCPDNFMIMASGGQEVRAMHPPSRRVLQKGDLVTTELTPCVNGYYAQICRTLVIGPPSAEQQQAFDVHLEALEAGLALVRPGVTAGEITRAENDVFRAHGLAQYVSSEYTRVRGHGLGLYVDSPPAFVEEDTTPLQPDMTVIVHPNGYHPLSGYLVLGDMVVVREGGYELMTQTPRQLFSV